MRIAKRAASLVPLLMASTLAAWGAGPNILLMMADDLGWNDVGFNGSAIETPAIDSLAAEGLRLDRYYAFSLCTPTRVAIMTGRAPLRFGIVGPIIDRGGLPLEETTAGEIFQEAGYQTWYLGKWHLGHGRRAYLPNERGWDHSYGSLTGGLDHYSHNSDVLMGAPDWHRNGQPVEEEGHTTDLYTQEALRLLEDRDKEDPFFMYVSWNAPHAPLQAPEQYLERYAHIDNEVRRTYSAMVTHLDDSVASLIDALEREGLRQDTLVIWLSDNGGTPAGGGDNSPLHGGKGSPYEGGTRVPGLVNWPGTIEPGVLSQRVSALDWLPTLLSATGVTWSAAKPLDGFDMWPAIATGQSVERGDLVLGSRFGRALFRGKWKYVETVPGWLGLGAAGGRPGPGPGGRPRGAGRPGAGPPSGGRPGPGRPGAGRPGAGPPGAGRSGPGRPQQRSQQALYDVYADPAESDNLAAEHPELVKELAAFVRDFDSGAPTMPRDFSLRDGGMFARVGALETFPADRGAHVIDRIDE